RGPEGRVRRPRGGSEEDPEEDLEKDPEEDPEEDPKEDSKEDDDDDVMEIDDEAKVIDPYMDDGSNNPPPPNYEDEETPPTSPVIPDPDEKELVNEKNRKEFYRELGEYMCRMLQKRQKSKDSFPLPLGSQVIEPPAEPSARPVPSLHPDDIYVVTRDTTAAAAVATFGIDDNDDTAPMDSQPYEPRGSPRDTQ
nr:hypothetical protein [Tanacetum cinerariifolium]